MRRGAADMDGLQSYESLPVPRPSRSASLDARRQPLTSLEDLLPRLSSKDMSTADRNKWRHIRKQLK